MSRLLIRDGLRDGDPANSRDALFPAVSKVNCGGRSSPSTCSFQCRAAVLAPLVDGRRRVSYVRGCLAGGSLRANVLKITPFASAALHYAAEAPGGSYVTAESTTHSMRGARASSSSPLSCQAGQFPPHAPLACMLFGARGAIDGMSLNYFTRRRSGDTDRSIGSSHPGRGSFPRSACGDPAARDHFPSLARKSKERTDENSPRD